MSPTPLTTQSTAITVFETLQGHYPPASTFLTHDGPFQLLIAVILSAQCTDKRVNMVTPDLFKAYPDPASLSKAPLKSVQTLIKSINFFNTKAKNIIATAQQIMSKHQGEVPQTLDALTALPGVGRKTANVVLGQAFGIPGITVDTHVNRLSRRLGFSTQIDAVKAEYELMALWPESLWNDFSTLLILHGRHVCYARTPHCSTCIIQAHCPKTGVTVSK